jgi:hypothetical protein
VSIAQDVAAGCPGAALLGGPRFRWKNLRPSTKEYTTSVEIQVSRLSSAPQVADNAEEIFFDFLGMDKFSSAERG